MNRNLLESFGNIDIYLFDQLLKGRYDFCRTVLDVGCGAGRNMVYFLKNGFEVYGIDQDAMAVEQVRALSQSMAPHLSPENFVVGAVDDMPFRDAAFDLVICSAVLHFARNKAHFEGMLQSVWRVLRPGGFFFARLASDIGIENRVQPVGEGRYLLPDGSVRYLVNEQMLVDYTHDLGGVLSEPIKTTNVSDQRCMTTWCVQKDGA